MPAGNHPAGISKQIRFNALSAQIVLCGRMTPANYTFFIAHV